MNPYIQSLRLRTLPLSVSGIILGPHLLGVIPQDVVDRMSFVSDVALAFRKSNT